jgi:ferredoxin
MTPEEAAVLLEAKDWQSCEQLAKKLKMDPKVLQPMLESLEKRQIIRSSHMGYATPPNLVAFHHGAVMMVEEEEKAKLYPLWGDFFYEDWRDILVDGFIKRKKSGAPGGHRVVPARKALLASPKIKKDQVLWYEDMEQILRHSEKTNLMTCGCRGLWAKCDMPVDVCLKVQYSDDNRERNRPPMKNPPKDAAFEEALAEMDRCEDLGLVHIPLNTSHGDLFCNCCDDCCMVINPLLKRDKVQEILSPSRFRAVVDQSLCNGCQKCVERCYFNAVDMQKIPGSKKMKSSVVKDMCMGCGLCVVTCPQKALTMELVRPPEHIPTLSVVELLQWGKGF